MGQSINVTAFSLHYKKNWLFKTYSDNNYSLLNKKNNKIKKIINSVLIKNNILFGKIVTNDKLNNTIIHLFISKSLSKKSITEIKNILKYLKNKLEIILNKKVQLIVDYTPFLDSKMLSNYAALLVESRLSFQAITQKVLQLIKEDSNIIGFKLQISGRPNGADMASVNWYINGNVPLHTYKTNIDYSTCIAYTKYGTTGVKVWINMRH